jgi:hypothetical protein
MTPATLNSYQKESECEHWFLSGMDLGAGCLRVPQVIHTGIQELVVCMTFQVPHEPKPLCF